MASYASAAIAFGSGLLRARGRSAGSRTRLAAWSCERRSGGALADVTSLTWAPTRRR